MSFADPFLGNERIISQLEGKLAEDQPEYEQGDQSGDDQQDGQNDVWHDGYPL